MSKILLAKGESLRRTSKQIYAPDRYNSLGAGRQNYSGFPTLDAGTKLYAITVAFPDWAVDGVKTISGIYLYAGASTGPGLSDVFAYPCTGSIGSAVPTGNWSTKAGAIGHGDDTGHGGYTMLNNGVTVMGLNVQSFAPQPWTPYAFVFTLESGTSWRMGGSPGHRVHGWDLLYTATIENELADIEWEWQPTDCGPGLMFTFSDGARYGNIMGVSGSSAGNIAIHGADAYAGVEFMLPFKKPLLRVGAELSVSGTPGSAGAVVCSIFDESNNVMDRSLNQISAAEISASLRQQRPFHFGGGFAPEQDRAYRALIHQAAAGGSGSHNVRLGGAVTTLYMNGAPPRTALENAYFGFNSKSTTTGLGNLAHESTTGHSITLEFAPWSS